MVIYIYIYVFLLHPWPSRLIQLTELILQLLQLSLATSHCVCPCMGPMIHLSTADLGPSVEGDWSRCKCVQCGLENGGCQVTVHRAVQFLPGGLCGNCRPENVTKTKTKAAENVTKTKTKAAEHANVTMAKPK